jgi:CO dehydrogenase maturation factor
LEEKGNHWPLKGKRIGVFGKGGAGKSTITSLISKGLKKRGYAVIVLDADSTNLGLYRILEIEHPPKPLMDYFGGTVFSGGLVTCPVDDPAPLAEAEIELEKLKQAYCACSPEGILFFIAGKIGDKGPGAGCDGPVAKIARDFRVIVNGQSPVTLIDFKAGLEDIARGVVTSLDLVVFVIDPSLVSVEMAGNMKEIVRRIQTHERPATAHLESPELIDWANQFYSESHIAGIQFILNRINSKEEEEILRDSLKKEEIEPSCTIYQIPSISSAWLKGIPIRAEEPRMEIQTLIECLEDDMETYIEERE